VQVDEGVVRLQDIITQLQKCDNLPAETEKAVERARALIKDSASSRQVCTHYRFCVIKTGMHSLKILRHQDRYALIRDSASSRQVCTH